jgi:hypothetical protein
LRKKIHLHAAPGGVGLRGMNQRYEHAGRRRLAMSHIEVQAFWTAGLTIRRCDRISSEPSADAMPQRFPLRSASRCHAAS